MDTKHTEITSDLAKHGLDGTQAQATKHKPIFKIPAIWQAIDHHWHKIPISSILEILRAATHVMIQQSCRLPRACKSNK